MAEKKEITFDIVKSIGVLSSTPSNWQKELNMVSWNNNPAKLDIRDWNQDHDRMRKGLTLTCEEAKMLREILSDLDLDALFGQE